jgi:hypothetical protein
MKIKCPECAYVQDTPEEQKYENVKCMKCGELYMAYTNQDKNATANIKSESIHAHKNIQYGGKKIDWDKFIWVFFTILIIIIVLSKANENKNDNYAYNDGKLIFTESKNLLGSIFHKNTLILSDDNVEIIKPSFFGSEKTVIPYKNIKRVTFSKALMGYKVVIESPGGILNETNSFYFNQRNTFQFLQNVFEDYCKNRFVLTISL